LTENEEKIMERIIEIEGEQERERYGARF